MNGCTAACWSKRDRQLWLANKRLRQAEFVAGFAVDTCTALATLDGPMTWPVYITIHIIHRAAKNKCDAIKVELPPWVERRGVIVLEAP